MLAATQQSPAEETRPDAAEAEESGPGRRCLASGERLPKEELLRLVVGPDGAVVPDLAERLPGRGLWIRPRRALIETAVRRRLFARAAKATVTAPPDLAEQIGRLLRRRCLERIGLAKRAGQLAVGHDQVRATLEGGRALLLIQAADGSDSERRRVAALGRGRCPELAIDRQLGSAELGEALGRATAVHLAVTDARMADRLRRELRRLADYETSEASETAPARTRGGGETPDGDDTTDGNDTTDRGKTPDAVPGAPVE